MRFAYADPPYIGMAKRFYSADPKCAEVDHAVLIAHLEGAYPDGWCLSLSVNTLPEILAMCPPHPRCRVMAWVKPFASFKPGVGLAYAWEPVIIAGGRKRSKKERTTRDWHSANITMRKGLTGAKPKSFCHWLLDALNFQPGDELDDLYPGTGVMGDCVRERSGVAPVSCELFA